MLGVDVDHISQLQGRLSILPQDALFQRNVPILEQLAFFRVLDGKSQSEAEDEVQETLEKVGLAEYSKRGVHALSHGMLKRMGIAQAFLGNPEVILLDEPTSGMSGAETEQAVALIRDISATRTMVIVEHDMGVVFDLADRISVLVYGQVIATGTPEEIRANAKVQKAYLGTEAD